MQRFIAYCHQKNINVFQVRNQQFYCYLMTLFDDNAASSTVVSNRTSSLILRHWKYDPATDPNTKMILQGIWLARPVQRNTMPQWNLHVVLISLLWPLFATAGDRPTDSLIDLKWWTLKTCFLLAMAMTHPRSFLHELSVAHACIAFGQDVEGCTHLFLHWKPHISKWIVEVVKTAYQSNDQDILERVMAHDLRALASSWAYTCHDALEDVLSAMIRRSSGVFKRNYLCDLAPIASAMATLDPVVMAQHVCRHQSVTHFHTYRVVHTLIHSTKRDYLVNSRYLSSRCVGLV